MRNEPAFMAWTSLFRRLSVCLILIVAVCSIAAPAIAADADATGDTHSDSEGPAVTYGSALHPLTILPFAAMLLSIAVLPLFAPHWWEHNSSKGIVVAILSVPLAIYLVAMFGHVGLHALAEKMHEYISFIMLLGALFVISGGIYVQGSLSGTPLLNTALLGFGAVLANAVGTTGASMLLIRPMLRANQSRERKTHIFIFFIFIVSNCGGLLTPLGDPPLFLGFLNGVPFEWTLRLWKEWAFVNIALLVIFNIWDQIVFSKEEKKRPGSQLEQVQVHEPLRVRGLHNLLLLAGVVAVVYGAGKGIGNDEKPWPPGVQEGLMLGLTLISYFSTPKTIHENNSFNFGPIIEVAVLFIGIFITMTPALLLLNVHGKELGINEPWQYFWAAGILSSFLDNAPTYLTFAATACGTEGVPLQGRYLETFLALPASSGAAEILAAISCGSVFMGANTYIGNGPNFMVKAIADQSGVKMPSFFGYMLYSIGVLIPIFIVVTFVFFL
jgi:Na+/H+ antiporter NhaD/arsenite permease-like protein